jgi:hypothetical protein
MDITVQGMRWITVGPADQPGTSIVLEPPFASSVLATVRPLSSPEVKRLGLVRRTEVLRNG